MPQQSSNYPFPSSAGAPRPRRHPSPRRTPLLQGMQPSYRRAARTGHHVLEPRPGMQVRLQHHLRGHAQHRFCAARAVATITRQANAHTAVGQCLDHQIDKRRSTTAQSRHGVELMFRHAERPADRVQQAIHQRDVFRRMRLIARLYNAPRTLLPTRQGVFGMTRMRRVCPPRPCCNCRTVKPAAMETTRCCLVSAGRISSSRAMFCGLDGKDDDIAVGDDGRVAAPRAARFLGKREAGGFRRIAAARGRRLDQTGATSLAPAPSPCGPRRESRFGASPSAT